MWTCPGYGYARVPREITNRWQGFVDPYLTNRPTLALCLCLVDANVPPQKNDAQLIEFLQHVDRHLLVVATKADKVGSRLQSALEKMRQGLGVDKILPFSSKSGMGKDELWKLMRMAVERSDEESERPGRGSASYRVTESGRSIAARIRLAAAPAVGTARHLARAPDASDPISGTKRHPPRLVTVNWPAALRSTCNS